MRKICLLLIIFLSLIFTGVASASEYTVAVCAAAVHHEFSYLATKGAVDTLEKAGIDVIFTEAGGDELQQVAQIESAIQRGVDALIIHGITASGIQGTVEKAAQKNIPIVCIDVPLTGDNVIATVSSDNYEAGLEMARYLVGRLGGEGNIVAMYTPGIPVLDYRYRMLRLVLEDFPKIKIVAELPWRAPAYTQSSMDEMEMFLKANPQKGAINAVWSAADMPAIGAAMAISKAGREDEMFIISMDALPEALDLIKTGPHFAATVAQRPYEMGISAAEAVINHFAGREVLRWEYVPFTLVTQYNVDEFIKK